MYSQVELLRRSIFPSRFVLASLQKLPRTVVGAKDNLYSPQKKWGGALPPLSGATVPYTSSRQPTARCDYRLPTSHLEKKSSNDKMSNLGYRAESNYTDMIATNLANERYYLFNTLRPPTFHHSRNQER